MNSKNLEGRGHGLFEGSIMAFTRENDENHDKCHSQQPLTLPRLEQDIYQIQA
jgi:hypothetical protein